MSFNDRICRELNLHLVDSITLHISYLVVARFDSSHLHFIWSIFSFSFDSCNIFSSDTHIAR